MWTIRLWISGKSSVAIKKQSMEKPTVGLRNRGHMVVSSSCHLIVLTVFNVALLFFYVNFTLYFKELDLFYK